ncbi:MAG: hypothetical protein WCL07_01355 [bacterium]
MKRILLLLLFGLFWFARPTLAFTDNFNATISQESMTQVVNPGHSYNLEISAQTSSATLPAYPVALVLGGSSSYSEGNSWVNFDKESYILTNQTPTTVSWVLTIPADTKVGEYELLVGIADTKYIDGMSINPPTVLAIPLIVDVTAAPISSPTPTPTPTATVTPTVATSAVPTSTETTPPPAAKFRPVELFSFETVPPTDLSSKIVLESFATSFDVWSQILVISMTIKNNGNLSATPEAFVNIENSGGKLLANVPFDINTLLGPGEEQSYTSSYSSPQFELGGYNASLNLGYRNIKVILQPALVATNSYWFVSNTPIRIFAGGLITIIVVLLLRFPKRKKYLRKVLVILALTVTVLLLLRGYLQCQAPSSKTLGTFANIDITGDIERIIGIKTIVNESGQKLIVFTNLNPVGAKLWSLQNGVRVPLASLVQHTEAVTEFALTTTQEQYPILMMTNGY